jgi:hypothetical protein
MHRLEFEARHRYDNKPSGITVPVDLGYGGKRVRLDAKVDTGAEYCLFARGYGEILGIDIEKGERLELRTVNSSLVVYGHEVSLSVLGLDFQLIAYFPEDATIRRSLLGRRGWLLQIRFGVVDYEQLIYLSPYGS